MSKVWVELGGSKSDLVDRPNYNGRRNIKKEGNVGKMSDAIRKLFDKDWDQTCIKGE